MYYALIVIIFIVIVITCLLWLIINANDNETEENAGISDYFINDCHLQRLLMIETLRQPSTSSDNSSKSDDSVEAIMPSIIPSIIPGGNSHIASEIITAGHIKQEITAFSKALNRYFNNNTVQVITTLMNKRQNILQEYYRTMHVMICDKGSCILPGKNNQPVRAVFPDPLSHDSSDVTTLVHRRLSENAREITDTLAAAVNIHHKSTVPKSNHKEEFQHQRLYNLLVIYDKGLINQAKSYAAHEYDISMNSAQSSMGIAHHINEEFRAIISMQRRQKSE